MFIQWRIAISIFSILFFRCSGCCFCWFLFSNSLCCLCSQFYCFELLLFDFCLSIWFPFAGNSIHRITKKNFEYFFEYCWFTKMCLKWLRQKCSCILFLLQIFKFFFQIIFEIILFFKTQTFVRSQNLINVSISIEYIYSSFFLCFSFSNFLFIFLDKNEIQMRLLCFTFSSTGYFSFFSCVTSTSSLLAIWFTIERQFVAFAICSQSDSLPRCCIQASSPPIYVHMNVIYTFIMLWCYGVGLICDCIALCALCWYVNRNVFRVTEYAFFLLLNFIFRLSWYSFGVVFVVFSKVF